jgi:hypothetical protein
MPLFMRRAPEQASDHLSDRCGGAVKSTESGRRGQTDRRASLDLHGASVKLADGERVLDKPSAT